jgi:hypothetical protein
MSEGYVLPGYYNLNSAVITKYESGAQVDIQNIVTSFNIIESIDLDSMRGTIEVFDTIGFIENFPLRGEERIQLTVQDPFRNVKTFDLFVFKITDVQIKPSNDGLTYTLHFTSYSRFKAGLRMITTHYENVISVIAQDIYDKHYDKEIKPFEVEATEGIFRCVIPKYTPMQSMRFLASRAFSTQSPSCSFRFFENNESFCFVSDEYLLKKAFEDDGLRIKEFTYDDNIDKSGAEFLAQMQNLSDLKNVDRADMMNDLYSGGYTNNVVELDLIKKRVVNNRYNYLDNRSRYMSFSERGSSRDSHSEKFIRDNFTQENERKFLLIKDYATLGDEPSNIRGEQYLSQITSNRVAYRHHLNGIIVEAKSYGRLDIKAGDVIKLLINEFTSDSSKGPNPQLSGNYILHSITHIFVNELYEMHFRMMKYDWGGI